ncbi:hypothetical protein [Microbispora bryophytorum]|uniref:hypothetical protein n=1 Tax=Microbispora bryophytorum TaxID=1460882 RepID=UPI0033FD06F2
MKARGVEAVLVGRDPVRLARAAASVGFVHVEKRVATVDDQAGLVEALRGCDALDFLDDLARRGIRWSIEEPPAG